MLLYFRPCLLSVYASLAVRFSAGALLCLSPGHGSFDPLSWQGRFVRYPVGRIFSCCFGKKIPSLGRARERAFFYPRSNFFILLPMYRNGFSISREQMTSPFTLYSTLFSGLITENKSIPQLVEHENDPKIQSLVKIFTVFSCRLFIGALFAPERVSVFKEGAEKCSAMYSTLFLGLWRMFSTCIGMKTGSCTPSMSIIYGMLT